MSSSSSSHHILLLFTIIIITITFATSSPSSDLVERLPGWSADMPSRCFSGFLDAGIKDGKHQLFHHYVLVESESGQPDKDPVLVWSNGGPGASSMFGLLVELGPLLLDGDKFVRNPLSWSQHANLLILNGPPPVGFSYCTPAGQAGDFKSCGEWDDASTAKHNALAIQSFVRKHPRFAKSDWFFTGESYAGIYIPTLVQQLTEFPAKDFLKLNIRGMLIVNGCVGTDVLCFSPGDAWWRILFLRGHAQISERGFMKFDQECGASYRISQPSSDCVKKAAELEKGEAGSFFEYDMYSQCAARDWRLRGSFCTGDVDMARWVARFDVKTELHVDPTAKFCSGDNGEGFTYHFTERDVRPFYRRFLQTPNTRVVVVSGDTDVSVNVVATQNWTESMGFKEVAPWRPWSFDPGYVAGHVVRWEKGFELVTVRGSGHMVPQFKARAAFEILNSFLRKRQVNNNNAVDGLVYSHEDQRLRVVQK